MTRRDRRVTVVLLVAAALLCSAVGSVAGAGTVQAQTSDGVSPPTFVVALQADGSAEVTVTYTFDLTDETRREAFESLRTNETATRAFEDRFRSQLQSVAAAAENETGREMTVTEVNIAFETNGDTGIVRLTATWDGLAAVDGDKLTVTEPFASGFAPDRPFVVRVPNGYAVESVTPTPDQRTSDQLTWAADTTLDGFALTVAPSATPTPTPTPGQGGETPSPTPTDGDDGNDDRTATPTTGGDETATPTTGGGGPGFDVVVGILALLGAGLLAARH